MADLLTSAGTISDALNQIVVRLNGKEDGQTLPIPYVFRQVLMHLNNKPMKIFALLFFITIFLLVVSRKYELVPNKTIIPILIISMYPFVWYSVVKEHSATHAQLEQREMAIFIMAAIVAVLFSLRPRNSKR